MFTCICSFRQEQQRLSEELGIWQSLWQVIIGSTISLHEQIPRAVRAWGPWGGTAQPAFWQISYPFSTRGAYHAHHITTYVPPGFSDPPTDLIPALSLVPNQGITGSYLQISDLIVSHSYYVSCTESSIIMKVVNRSGFYGDFMLKRWEQQFNISSVDCGILKMVGPKKEVFWLKNQYSRRKPLYFENMGSTSSSKIGHDFRK